MDNYAVGGYEEGKVQVRDLTKKFGDLLVLNHMDFDVEEGDLLCVVGPTISEKQHF